ncbi:MAG: TRAP transporter permease, partial [Methyloligellaceae bacterium]
MSQLDRERDQALNPIQIGILTVGFLMAIIGITNSMPTYGFLPKLGPYPSVIIRPLILAASIFIVIASNPFSRSVAERWPEFKWAGYIADVALVALGWFVLWAYYSELTIIEEEGFIDFTLFHAVVSLLGCFVFIVLCWKIWGAPLAIVGIASLVYLFTGEYWPWIFETSPLNYIDFLNSSEDIWFNLNDGVLGTLMGILIFTVFPFILLGTMLEQTGGGRSMIKFAVQLTKNFRGGAAHAAILASGLFGTMSGGAVTNVVATGVITIPMIKRRGFSPAFAGGVEATASSAGQIMPPIMGAAALVMSDLTGISYLTIIVAALIPALAYYSSLFTSVLFEARRLNVEESLEDLESDEFRIEVQDYVNLIMVIAPIFIVVYSLIIGLSPAGAGMSALFALIPLSFFNPLIRNDPRIILHALARGGTNFAQLLMAISVVGIIVGVLGATGLPQDFALLLGKTAGGAGLFVTLIVAAVAALMLGMGMPTLPAYLTIVLILGPAMQTLGLSVLAAHLFVFYYGVASSITPPVAVAAYAAASIAGGAPFKTALMAMRIGLAKFAVPFIFAFYPVLLIVPEAFNSGASFTWFDFISALFRLILFIYIISSIVIAFDRRRLPVWEMLTRILLALGIMSLDPLIHSVAVL